MFYRKPRRWDIYDYTSLGPYFITICTYERQKLFGYISDTKFHYFIPELETLFNETYQTIEKDFPGIKFQIKTTMPNHVHFIVSNNNGINISKIITKFKLIISQGYKDLVYKGKVKRYEVKIWQKDFYDHVIRNDKEYEEISTYIYFNPQADWYKLYMKLKKLEYDTNMKNNKKEDEK